jgi:hypothetical protein
MVHGDVILDNLPKSGSIIISKIEQDVIHVLRDHYHEVFLNFRVELPGVECSVNVVIK